MRLSELKTKQQAKIVQVHHEQSETGQGDSIATRLGTLGFVAGESIEVVTKSLFGGDPILVKVGFTRFALRRNEAERIEIKI